MTILIFLVSLIPRLIFINSFPPSPNWDEVSLGYNAYSILKTGRDEWGRTLPLIFRAYGDYKLPLYIYLDIIPIALLGLNPVSVRLISIIAGSLIPVIIYLILKKITHPRVALLGSLVASFSPWAIFLSRIALEANLFLLLFLVSLYFLFSRRYSFSSIFYALALFTYNSSRVLLPLYLLALIFSFFKHRPQKINYLLFIPFFLSLILIVFQTFSPSGQARYQWVSLLDSGAINQINQLRQHYPRLIVNKATYFTFTAAKNYLSHFNPSFLFQNGGSHYQFNIPNFYLITPLLLPLFLLGLFQLKKHPLILFFLLIAPLPSAITRDAPHTLRSITLLPLAIIVISLGLKYLPKITFPYFVLAIVVSQLQFWPAYQSYAQKYSSSWQYGYQQVVDTLKSNYSQYQNIVITKKYGEPHEFLLFYWPWDPSSYQKNKSWDFHANWYWINGFDKFQFVNDWDTQNLTLTPSTLLITSPNNYRSGRLIKTINFLDGQPAFDIVAYD